MGADRRGHDSRDGRRPHLWPDLPAPRDRQPGLREGTKMPPFRWAAWSILPRDVLTRAGHR
jgi:hypothetical protein